MSSNTDHVRNAHEHLRHDATADPNEEVRERLRREELAAKRQIDRAQQQQTTTDDQKQQNG